MVSKSDYGQLKSVILGVADNFTPHIWGWKERYVSLKNFDLACQLANSVITDQIRSEVISDLEAFESQLKSLNIDVLRPPKDNFDDPTETLHHISYGNDFYNMRDLQVVLDDVLLTAAPASPPRIAEVNRLNSFLSEIALQYKLKIINSEIPILKQNPVEEFIYNGFELESIENRTGIKLGGDYPEVWHRLKEEEILFDAANIARFNSNLIFLVSSTGNRLAFNWLKDNFKDKYDVIYTDVYRSSHIDSTIMPLGDNTVLVNAARVNSSNIPEILKSKKIIYFDQVAPIPESEVSFHKRRKYFAHQIKELGFHSNLWEMSSPWAGLNILVINQNLVAVESRQTRLIHQLEKLNINVMPVRYRHPYTFLGGLHCTTLDLHRI